jgi:hypothetical protein
MSAISSPNVGTDSQIRIVGPFYGGIPDAWRFDDAGCQSGRLSFNNDALGKSCPAMKGSNAFVATHYGIDVDGSAFLRLTISYDAFSPSAASRYTIWKIFFDLSHASVGPTPPDNSTCGDAEYWMNFLLDFAKVVPVTGPSIPLSRCGDYDPGIPCAQALWNGGGNEELGGCPPPVATLPATWGKLKGMYR